MVATGYGGFNPTWYSGTAVPSTLHLNGDIYLRTTTGDVYQQQSSAWVLVGNILGPAGAAGLGMFTYSFTGILSVRTGTVRYYNDAGRTLSIGTVRASVGTASVGASINTDVKINGTSIFSSGGPSIAASAVTATQAPATTTIAGGQYFTIDITQVGSTSAGSDLVVAVPVT